MTITDRYGYSIPAVGDAGPGWALSQIDAFDRLRHGGAIQQAKFDLWPDGTDNTTKIQFFLDALAGDVGHLLPGDYRITAPVYGRSGMTLWAPGARLLCPSGAAFNAFNMVGTAGTHLTDWSVHGLAVDMAATGLATSDANAWLIKYADRFVLDHIQSSNAGFEGILISWATDGQIVAPYVKGAWGDGIHFGISEVGEIVKDMVVICPIIVGRAAESGIATTGDLVSEITVVAPHVRDYDRGFGFSGGHNLQVLGGVVRRCRIGATTEYVDYGGGNIDWTYDVIFDGLRISEILPGTGVGQAYQIATANFGFPDRPIIVRNGLIEAGDQLAFLIGSAGDVIVESTRIRTTGYAFSIQGSAGRPNGTTVVRDCELIGCAFGFAGNVAAYSGTLITEGNTYRSVTNKVSDTEWPLHWETPNERVFFKGTSYTTNATIAELDVSTRVTVFAGNRINLTVYIEDAGGAGQVAVQLYDVTHATVIQSALIASGTVGKFDLHTDGAYGRPILAADAELTVRAGRTLAGSAPGVKVKSATLQIG